jgi:subtilisin family serine protease
MQTSYRDALSQPEFDALVIQFRPPVTKDMAQQAARLLATAVQQVLATSVEGWQINPVPGMPAYFDLIPPPDPSISVKQGFDLKNTLRKDESLLYVNALFETNLDNLPEEVLPDEALTEAGEILEDLATPLGNLTAAERNPLWNHQIVNSQAAWALSRGQGILIGHPDSGYIPHVELDPDRVRRDLEANFYDSTPGAANSADRGGNHGLGTATVLMSGKAQQSEAYFVTGIAPEAVLVPMRITQKGAPIFFTRSGPRRVRNAVLHAINSGCHVISMSLGGLPEKSLHEAIQEAVRRNIIICAAAGNVVQIVIWPARYKEVIAVAACTAERKRWTHSSRGPTVDVTAPGHNVWRACIDQSGNETSLPGSGTSYATPHVAGIAALWLAKHGRDNLLQKYSLVPLSLVFREVLKAACDPPPEGDGRNFGAGIVNALQTLTTPLPDEDDLLAQFLDMSFGVTLSEGVAAETDSLSDLFDTLPRIEARQRLAALLEVPEVELEARLQDLNTDELTFFLLTNPDLREFFTNDEWFGLELTEGADLESAAIELVVEVVGQTLHEILLDAPLSDELYAQLTAVADTDKAPCK